MTTGIAGGIQKGSKVRRRERRGEKNGAQGGRVHMYNMPFFCFFLLTRTGKPGVAQLVNLFFFGIRSKAKKKNTRSNFCFLFHCSCEETAIGVGTWPAGWTGRALERYC